MANLEDLKRMLAKYSKTYIHPDRPRFTVAIPFDLFPDRGTSNPKELAWPSKWPAAENPGVYAMLDEKFSVLYVGKASLGNTLGRRLSDYFRYGQDQKCQLKHKWQKEPRYLITIACPIDAAFEAPSLEEYLILTLKPLENQQGQLAKL